MTDSGHAPHVVHRPYYRFGCCDPPDLAERQHALIHPIEHHDIGIPYEMMLRQGKPYVCYGDFKQIPAVESARHIYPGMLCKKTELTA